MKYFRKIEDGSELIIEALGETRWLRGKTNALIIFINYESTGGWYRTYTDEEFSEFEVVSEDEITMLGLS